MINKKRKKPGSNNKGFTIIELAIATCIATIVLATIFSIYTHQQTHYNAQTVVTEMQQNIRGGMNVITREIRMAGFGQFGAGVAKIVNAKRDFFYFTVDRNKDGDTEDAEEHIAYDIYLNPTTGVSLLGRTSSNAEIPVTEVSPDHWEATGHQPVAEHIEHLEFLYLDKEGNPTSTEEEIRTVVITLLAKAKTPDPKFTNTQTYKPASNLARYISDADDRTNINWVKNDHFRRRIHIMSIQCRNIGV